MGERTKVEKREGEVLSLKIIENALRSMFSEKELRPYFPIGNGLYELPGCIITNEEGLKEYLNELKKI